MIAILLTPEEAHALTAVVNSVKAEQASLALVDGTQWKSWMRARDQVNEGSAQLRSGQ